MPNYRNKNRNRNKNKQRNKQQQQQQQQKQKEENCKKESEEPTTAPTTGHETPSSPLTATEVTNATAVSSENNVAEDVDTSATNKSNEFDVCENVPSLKKVPDVTTATTGTETEETRDKTTETTTATNDTVLNEPSQCDNKSINNHGVNTNDNMGNEKSKIIDHQRDISIEENTTTQASSTATDVPPISPSTCALGKVIVHRIVCEDSNSVNTTKEPTAVNLDESTEAAATDKSENEMPFKVIIHKILTEPETGEENSQSTNQTVNMVEQTQQQVKIIVHKVETPEEDIDKSINYSPSDENDSPQQQVKTVVHKVDTTNAHSQQHEVKVIVHKVVTPDNDNDDTKANFEPHQHQTQPLQQQAKVIVHQVLLEDKDIDDEPQITSPTMREPLASIAKSTTSAVRIVEVSDESLSDLEELRSPVISEAESSMEYCDDIQKVADSITEVSSSSSSSSSSSTSTQKQSRKQKRIALEHHFLPQMLNPRFLDSISEENSELSDNSENPLSRSASNDSATNCPTEGKVPKLNAKYPKSSLDFSKSHKQQSTTNRKSKVIREEPMAVAVAARLQDAPDADESCSTVRSCMSPEAEAAEVVFISNSASSSMSDLHDMELFENVHTSAPEYDLDTDLSDIINKPVTEDICFESLTSSASTSSPSPSPSAFTAKIPQQQQQLPEFCANQYNNNQTINNSKHINNNNTPQTPYTTSATATNTTTTSININTTKTRSLAETITTKPKANSNTNTDSKSDSILLLSSSTSSSPANEQLVFAQIEEQISSALSSINEVASQNTTTTIPTTTSITSSSLSSSSSSSTKIHTNLSNTQKLPVTTTSTTAATRTPENSCEESFNTNSSSSLCAGNNAKTTRVFSQDVNMNTVRDLIINNNNNNNNNSNANDNTVKLHDLKTNTTEHCEQSDDSSGSAADPKKLRLLCAETLATFPYGDAVLEELATVAQNIGEARAVNAVKSENNMPYPLPELPHIDDLQLSLKVGKSPPERPEPPQQDQSWLGVPTNNDPKVLVCLSPSQRSYIQHKPEQKPDDLLDAHQKFVERRGYHEYTKEQLDILEREKLAEQQLLQTAAMMKKLRKSITPPPPQIPPPPVPVKSSETASKAQNLSKRTVTTTTITHTQKPNDDVNLANDNEQIPAPSNGENNGEENKHRLLSIIQDTSELNANKQIHSVSSSASSFENNSRQTTNGVSAPSTEQVPTTATSTLNNGTPNNSYQFPHLSEHKGSGIMQSVETTLGQMFPTMGSSNIFDHEHKRFSNIESSNTDPFCSQIMNIQPKRYSSVETHSYETQKRIENGKVVQDFSTSKHESKTSGDKPNEVTGFPLKTPLSQESNSFLRSGKEQDIHNNSQAAQHIDDQEIMSALNLNKHSSDIERKQQTATQKETTIKTTTTETSQNNANGENKSAKTDEKDLTRKQEPENTILKRGIQDTYEEFRQRAKAAADAASTLPSLNSPAVAATTAKVTSNGDTNGEMISSTTTTTEHKKQTTTLSHDHEKLFKEFDDLSKQLHRELETGKAEREQREKSASMFDLNRVHMRQKHQIEEFNKSRHGHLKELEQEIERSMKSRSMTFKKPQDMVDHQTGRTYQIPIHIENGNNTSPPTAATTAKPSNTYEEAPPVPEPPKTYQIPIQIENSNSSYLDDARFRRAESMFNLGDDMHQRQRTYSNQTQFQRADDDWSKYASDLGSSENIARPFAKEVEICYQRRPGGIRAPRLSASTNDLYFNNQHSYDQYNAYNVRRHHAPMLNRAPEHSRPKFGSCYSMIERDPNPKYISTTTRRGVSPGPQPSGFFPLDGCHVREEDMRQRRASLPREIHEQQLKYILNKEEELRTEFERLQTERRRLMEEAQRAQAMQMPQTPTSPNTPTSPMTRPLRDHFRSTQKLPTLSEDEVFRQQMAEEWMNKVAEREERRLQNIIKISKIHEDEESSRHKANMEEEFLSRVKERRHKLAMPADSDWESGAESQPTTQAQLSEAEDVPPVKFIEGEKEASLRRLPRHLREFAKFSNHQKEDIEGGHREEHQEEERSEETTDNSVSRAFKKSSVVKTVKTLRAPMLPENGGHDTKLHYHKPRAYQIPNRPREPHLTDQRIQRRTNKQTRFAVTTNRRSWSESDLLQEIDKDLKLAKGFLFQDEKAQSPSMFAPKFKAKAPTGTGRTTQYSKPNGYQSEPEPNYDSDYSTIKYRTVNPNRLQSVSSALNVRKSNDTLYGTLPNPVKSGQNSYKNQPGRIEDYVTGQSSVSEKEKKEWWDEIMDIFNVQLDQAKLSSNYTEGNLSRALAKESGYTSDSNLVFRKKELPPSSPLSPVEQKQAYKTVQAGGEPPLFGFRKPAPEKSKDYDFPTPQLPPPPRGELLEQRAVSPNRYYESDVNIHFKTPVRQEFKYPLSEEDLAIRQAEHMQKLYQEERRRKYLQELQDMNSRRHTDNFTPSQKSPIPLNRYDDFPADLAPKTANQVKSIARALYNFQAQNSKELSFKKGDIIYIKRAIDKNWYEGEHNAMIGLFPANYVEIINKETVYPVQPQATVYRKPSEGQARAKYNFQAQSGVELSLNKGELVSLTRRVDDNWFEGRIANRKGIFPVSYVEVLTDIGAEDIAARTTTIQPTARPTLDALRTNINNEFNTLTRNGNQPPNAILRETRNAHKTDILHVDTSSEPLVYRALYKYRPQNSDELELQEGDVVHVLEKCDDGWYVGTSQRTGCFGTFPGNYVERV
ncbi:serine-rich adhesin for platelets isoform X10 [Calliphora vicina]|uniref:serine-rich adhesin for platelets isoform X10 n=2 Tax=Calliphora vicina TaxID=7373 RepID=UPI00325BE3F9